MKFLRLASTLLPLLLSAALLRAQPADAPLMALNELSPGMKGQVWTVFRGSDAESFEVEVTGVLQSALGPGKSLILCRLTDERVQSMGAVAGMSGSPLYIDGKLVGVLSYQIQKFETVRYAGFTPIADMLEISALPQLPTRLTPPAGPMPLPVRPVQRDGEPRSHASVDFAAAADARPIAPVFSLGGLSPQVASVMGPHLQALGVGPIALGGHTNAGGNGGTQALTDSAGKISLKPGGVVAAALAVGDITVAAGGTVSHVDGNRILAFGHPVLSLGAAELPMAEAEIVTILPSQVNSIKVSNTGRVIGSFSQDRLSGVYGEIGRTPSMVPIEISLPSRHHRQSLNFSVVKHEQLLPALAATGLSQAVLGSNEAGFTRGFKLTATVEFPGVAPVQFSQLYPGPQGFAQGVGELTNNLQLWLFNPYERTFPSRVHFAVEETPEVPIGFVELLQLSRAQAVPGGALTASLTWRGYQRGTSTEYFEIPVPADWAGKDVEVILATGPALDDLTGRSRNVPVAQLRSFEEYLNGLRTARAADGLYLAVVEKTRLFGDQRALTAELPGSMERIARGADSSRFQRRDAVVPLWETRVLPGRLFNGITRKPMSVSGI